MRISELVEKLNQIKEQKGNLLVAIYRNEAMSEYSTFNEGSYYNDVNLEVVRNDNTNLKNSFEEVIIVNESYFLGIY